MNSALSATVFVLFGALYLYRPILQFNGSHLITLICGVVLLPSVKLVFRTLHTRKLRAKSKESDSSIYGLDHARLHIRIQTPMWMNMGYCHRDVRMSTIFASTIN